MAENIKSEVKKLKLEDIKVKYFHPAVPPDGINMNDVYTVTEDVRGIYLTDGNKIFDLSFEKIKILFMPLKSNWHEIQKGIK